jgi:hypothetical protein
MRVTTTPTCSHGAEEGRATHRDGGRGGHTKQNWLGDIGMATERQVIEENQLAETIGRGEVHMSEWGRIVGPDPDYQLSTSHLRVVHLQVGRQRQATRPTASTATVPEASASADC